MPSASGSLPTSVSTVTMTSGSLSGQLWQSGTQPAVQRADGLMLRVDFTGPRLAISSAAFSPVDDNCIVVGDVCGGVFVFHLGKNQFSLVARYAGPITSVAWVDCASHIACVCGGAAYIVDVSTARSTSKSMQGPHKRPITRVAVPMATAPRGMLTLVSGDALSVWRAQDQTCLKMISSSSSFQDAAMTDEAIYTIEGHHTLRCWTTGAFTHLETMTMREFSFVALECSARQLFAATDNGTVVIFHDLSLGSALCAVHLLTTSPITSIVANRPVDSDAETIFGCVQTDGVVSFASLPPPKEMSDTTAANLVLSFRAMPSATGGCVNSNFRMVSCYGNKELKLFHLPTSKQAYDKLSSSSSSSSKGSQHSLNTFVSFIQRRGVDGNGGRPNWIHTASGNSQDQEDEVGRKNPYSNNNNSRNNSRSRSAGQRLASPNHHGAAVVTDTVPLSPPPKNQQQQENNKNKQRRSSSAAAASDFSVQKTRENAIRDRMPAPTSETMKNWLRVNLLNSAEAAPMNQQSSGITVGDFAHKVASQRGSSAARAAENTSSSETNNNTSSSLPSRPPQVSTTNKKFEDTSTVEGILGLRPMLDASSRQQNLDKLRCLLMRYGAFPEQYRGLIWRFLLCLPDKQKMQPYYALLTSRGSHGATPTLLKPFPLPDSKLKFALSKAVSCLCHHAPPFTAAHFVPATVFPFLHVFHADVQSVVEVVLAFYLNWGKEFFLYYPHMPVSIASVISQTLQQEDRELYDHFLSVGLGPEHFVWEPLMAVYTEVLSTNEWLQVMDHAFANSPIWLFLFHVRWLVQMRTLLLRVNDTGSMLTYFHKATPFDLNVAIQQTYRLQSRYMKNDITLLYERLETFPIDESSQSIVYPADFDCHESVVFSKQEQLKEIEEHEQQMKVASRRALIADRHAKEASMLEEAFIRRQRALVESKFDAANAAWEQKILLERERQRLRDVENEARLHAVQEQLRSASRIDALQHELGAAAETEEHAAMDRAMEGEKWKISEKMAKLEINRMEQAAKMKLSTMIQVAGANYKDPNGFAKYPPDNDGDNDNDQQQQQVPQKIVAKTVNSSSRRPSSSTAAAAATSGRNQNQNQNQKRQQQQQKQQQQQQNPNDTTQITSTTNLDEPLSPPTPVPPSQQQRRKSNNNNNDDDDGYESSLREKEDHQKTIRDAYERVQASQRAARAALKSDFSKTTIGKKPIVAGDTTTTDFQSTSEDERAFNRRRMNVGGGGGGSSRPGTARLSTGSTASSSGGAGGGGTGGGCPHGCCSTSTCSCVHTSLASDDPPAPLLPAHSRPLPSLHARRLARDDDDDDDNY